MRSNSILRSQTGSAEDLSRLTAYVALLRGVNLGGHNKVAMAELRQWCQDAGLKEPRSYIQSGNLVLSSELSEAGLRGVLEDLLEKHMGKPIMVMVRTLAQLRRVIANNPFAEAEPSRLIIFFLNDRPPGDALDELALPGGEEVQLAGREVYVHYPDGMGRSRLKLPLARTGTARNLNTLRKLVEMAEEL